METTANIFPASLALQKLNFTPHFGVNGQSHFMAIVPDGANDNEMNSGIKVKDVVFATNADINDTDFFYKIIETDTRTIIGTVVSADSHFVIIGFMNFRFKDVVIPVNSIKSVYGVVSTQRRVLDEDLID
ncbi:MAG: hypothetical protein LCH67_06180 [Bacteroidetes bacterium]|nr:hypothetical protein [Bacteroidota bacterium]